MRQFNSIFVYWGAPQSNALIRFVTRLAASSGAHVTIGDTVERIPEATLRALPASWEVGALIPAKKQNALGRVAGQMRRSGVKPSTILLQGDAADAVVETVVHDEHDLLVLHAPFTGMSDSDRDMTFRLVRESSSPVLLARDLRRRKRPRILVAVDAATWLPSDADNLNSQLVQAALWFAEHLDGEIYILNVWEPVSEGPMRWAGVSQEGLTDSLAAVRDDLQKDLEDTVKSYRPEIRVAHVHVEIGEPRLVIPKFAADNRIDLIVIGTFARSGLSGRIMGNSATAILDGSPCSMLIVPRVSQS